VFRSLPFMAICNRLNTCDSNLRCRRSQLRDQSKLSDYEIGPWVFTACILWSHRQADLVLVFMILVLDVFFNIWTAFPAVAKVSSLQTRASEYTAQFELCSLAPLWLSLVTQLGLCEVGSERLNVYTLWPTSSSAATSCLSLPPLTSQLHSSCSYCANCHMSHGPLHLTATKNQLLLLLPPSGPSSLDSTSVNDTQKAWA
jgi:hypothetical protein